MKSFRYLSAIEQLAAHLRAEISRGELVGDLPGVDKLAATLGCSPRTVTGALNQLEHEGILQKQGAGRPCQIAARTTLAPAHLRVKILLYDQNDSKSDYMVSLLHQLQEKGHLAGFAEKTLHDLGLDLKKVSSFAKQTDTDAWIVFGGSHDILEWFAARPTPAFALFGRQPDVHIAGTGPHKSNAIADMVRRLTELGHRRIVLLVHEERRNPHPGIVERAFLDELQAQGISTGPYNLPDWHDNPIGFHDRLSSLFKHTPPTALIPDTLELYMATLQFLAHHGIRVPEDISLVCTDPHPAYTWCFPAIARIENDSNFWVRKAVQWVDKVARGENDRRQSRNNAKFIDGASIGPAPK